NEQSWSNSLSRALGERHDHGSKSGIGVIGNLAALGDALHFSLRLLNSHAGIQPAHHVQVTGASIDSVAIQEAWFKNTWQPGIDLRSRETEIGSHHPDDGVASAIESDCLSDHRGIRSKLFRPQLVTENDNQRATGLVLVRIEVSAGDWRYPQH